MGDVTLASLRSMVRHRIQPGTVRAAGFGGGRPSLQYEARRRERAKAMGLPVQDTPEEARAAAEERQIGAEARGAATEKERWERQRAAQVADIELADVERRRAAETAQEGRLDVARARAVGRPERAPTTAEMSPEQFESFLGRQKELYPGRFEPPAEGALGMREIIAMSPEERDDYFAVIKRQAEERRAPPAERRVPGLAGLTEEQFGLEAARQRTLAEARPVSPTTEARTLERAAAEQLTGKMPVEFPTAEEVDPDTQAELAGYSGDELRAFISEAIKDRRIGDAAVYKAALDKVGQFAE